MLRKARSRPKGEDLWAELVNAVKVRKEKDNRQTNEAVIREEDCARGRSQPLGLAGATTGGGPVHMRAAAGIRRRAHHCHEPPMNSTDLTLTPSASRRTASISIAAVRTPVRLKECGLVGLSEAAKCG